MEAKVVSQDSPKLLDRLRAEIRVRHYSLRTEQAYVDWARRFILFHNKRHPKEMGAAELRDFLSHLAVDRNVSASTQNQAKSALLFLYREVLKIELPWLEEVISAKTAKRLPVVLTQLETRQLLGAMSGTMGLMASLLYGTGMRLMEGLRLRVKDVEFTRREIIVREGKGNKDRVTVLPENLILPLQAHLVKVKALHERDLDAGFGEVYLPDALAVKYPNAPRAWGWQFVFPSPVRSIDPRTGIERRHHVYETSVQRAVREASRLAGIHKPVT
ncbi:MAG: integrase, partial [Betaproteobacteria bacterium RBG_19FT_COMBO_58_11]